MKSLRLFGHTYSVEYVKDWQDPTGIACIDNNELVVRINANLPASVQEEALLHEILEAIDYRLETQLDHNKLCGISEVLYMIIRENRLFAEPSKRKEA